VLTDAPLAALEAMQTPSLDSARPEVHTAGWRIDWPHLNERSTLLASRAKLERFEHFGLFSEQTFMQKQNCMQSRDCFCSWRMACCMHRVIAFAVWRIPVT
jgi:hypothetical protein